MLVIYNNWCSKVPKIQIASACVILTPSVICYNDMILWYNYDDVIYYDNVMCYDAMILWYVMMMM